MERNNWQILLDVLTQRLQNRLHNIKKTDPVAFCLDNRDMREILTKYIDDFIQFQHNNKKLKNWKISEEKRMQGNDAFNSKNFEKSLDLYTESVFHAPKNEECLALAYANRSSVLFCLNKFEECLQDIDLALDHGYPLNNSAKLLLRMGKCLTILGRIRAAEAVFKKTLDDIKEKCRDNLEFYKKQLKQEILKVSKMDDRNGKNYELPEPRDGENVNFVSASDSLTVVYSKTKGRHVRARRDVRIGDVLFVEKPFALVALIKEACENCCSETVAPIPCWNCLTEKYCSESCRKKSWDEIHKHECGFGEFLKSVGIAHLALRVPLGAASTFNQFKKILKKIRTKQTFQDESVVELKGLGYENVYHLVTNMSSLEAKDLFQYALTASLLSLYMDEHTNYFSGRNEKNLKQFASAVLRHICQLVSNGHAITSVRNVNDDDKRLVASQIEERIGTAIYPSASMMNHSCDPSIVNSFYKNVLIVRASKDIKKDEEVFNCYGPHSRRMKRAERQDILFSQYRFRCNCSACTSPIDIQDIYTALRCQKCKGPSVRLSTEATELVEALKKETKSAVEDVESSICLACGHYANTPKELTRKEIEIENLLYEGRNLLSANENVSLALDRLLKSWRLGRQVLYKFHKNLNLAADSVARCLLLLEEHPRSIMFLRCSVLSVEAQFGTTSIELAAELKKLADSIKLYLSSNKFRDSSDEKDTRAVVEEAIRTYKRAKTIYLLLCCSNHPSLVEIEPSLNFLENYKY